MATKLTPTGIDKLEPKKKQYRVLDTIANSFYVIVLPKKKNRGGKGTKTFQYRWRYWVVIDGENKRKETHIPLGRWGSVSLEEARAFAIRCDKFARAGKDPHDVFKDGKSDTVKTFDEVYRRCFRKRTGFYPDDFLTKDKNFKKKYRELSVNKDLVSYNTARDMKFGVKRYLLPTLGDKNILEIKPYTLDEIIIGIKPQTKKDKDGNKYTCYMYDTRRKTFRYMQDIFTHARSHFPEMVYIPTLAVDMKRHLKDYPRVKKHMVTTTDLKGIQEIMWKIGGYILNSTRMSWQIKSATLILPLTHLRPGELCGLRWTEIDFKKEVITIPGLYEQHTEKPEKRMKMGRDHIIPMSRQLKSLLQQTKEHSNKEGIKSRYVFPRCTKYGKERIYHKNGTEYIDECISVDSLEDALKRMGVCGKTELTPHGWRAMASTCFNEGLPSSNGKKKNYKSKWVEVALSHHSILKEDGGKMAEPYNRAKYLDERKPMSQDWADFLQQLYQENPSQEFILKHPFLQFSSQRSLELLVQPKRKSCQ